MTAPDNPDAADSMRFCGILVLALLYDIILTVKKIVFFALFFLVTFFGFAITFQAQDIQGEHIQSFDSKIKINKDGTINVTEKIVYDFNDLYRHGIYREIPFIKTNNAGNPTSPRSNEATLGVKKLRLDFDVESVKDESDRSYNYTQTEGERLLRIKIGDANRTITGIHTYIISYKVKGALTYFSDHDELYWNLTGNEWTVPIASSTSGVELPVEVLQDKITTACYTGAVGSTEKHCIITNSNNPITFQSQDTLRVYEGMTVVVGFPKGAVAVLEPRVYLTFWETIWGKITIFLLILVAIFWYIIYPIWIPIKWYLHGRDANVGQEVQAWFDPPKTASGRFLAPEEVGGLIDESVDFRDFSGMVVYLAQKGYLRIEERKKSDFYFVRRSPPKADEGGLNSDSSLLPHQKYFLEKLFEDEEEMRVKDADLYDVVQKTSDMIYTDLVKQNFFPKDPNEIRKFYSAVGVFALTTLNIGLAFTAFVFGRNMPKKTVDGVETAKVGRSLKNFLSSQERQLEFLVGKSDLPAGKQVMFEKLLPYAIVFGVEKIWAKRFEGVKMKQPDWYRGYGGEYYSSALWMSSMNSSFSSFKSAATPTTSSSGYSSGFSGGSSGGGGGGGGGGSW